MIKTKTIRRRNYRNHLVFGLGLFVAVFLFVFLAQRFGKVEGDASAANLSNFQAGYIISDFQMTDYNSMSEGDISNFLWSKGRCYNTNFSSVGTRVNYFSDHTPPTTWHVSNGHTVCLAEENMNGESAAHIIWQAAQDYHINPKVLIVLIQKETGLITDPIPNSWDYQRTAGYGCPDTAACSEKYYGFKNQIRNAARLFRIVMDGNSSYYPIGNNYIQYNPNSGCGGSTVYIKNLATSALYRYTPYQPNAGALAAGYGTAPCGAYGNRNFYAYFEDWFGGTTWEINPLNDINNVYYRYGGENGVLGRKVSDLMKNDASGIYWVEYEHGYIVGNPQHGYHISMGPIREVWVRQGWEFGPLGWPKTDILTNDASGIEYQEFDYGYIVGNAQHGYFISMGLIREAWVNQGWEFGPLGFPISDIIEQGDKKFQKYENGEIVGTEKTGYHVSIGKIREKWAEYGYENGVLGYPITGILTNQASGIEWQQFEHGYIAGNKEHGYFISMGPIREAWVKQGWEFGPLGWPKTDILTNDASGIEYQEFDNGYIIGNEQHGYHISMGPIREVWVKQGWEFGPLGWPKTNILTNQASGIEWQEFERGFIVGNKEHGYFISMGPIREVWVKQGWEFGPLGFPTSDIIEEGNRKYQKYEHGYIIGNDKKGYYISTSEIYEVWKKYNYENGPLGFPKTSILTNDASGIKYQEFDNGYIIGNEQHGYHISMGPIREVWVKQGWEFGPLGFPTSDIIEEGDKKYQKYEGGKISYTESLGAWIES